MKIDYEIYGNSQTVFAYRAPWLFWRTVKILSRSVMRTRFDYKVSVSGRTSMWFSENELKRCLATLEDIVPKGARNITLVSDIDHSWHIRVPSWACWSLIDALRKTLELREDLKLMPESPYR